MTRIELDGKLREILGSNNTYFQPPSNVQMKYPAIVYKFEGYDIRHASNKRYIKYQRYTLTHIYRNIKESLKDQLLDAFDFIVFEDELRTDGLFNDTYTIYI